MNSLMYQFSVPYRHEFMIKTEKTMRYESGSEYLWRELGDITNLYEKMKVRIVQNG